MAASPEKRCLYEVLGLPRDCTSDEIRSAYRKLALQRHPDKLVRSGVSEAEATASFQELVNAYEVLSDPKERAWYDSHRSKILFASSDPKSKSSNGGIPDLFSFFSNSVFSGYSDKGKGFYKVYGDIFDKIYQNEVKFATKMGLGMVVEEPPLLGNLDSGYAQANAFYGYWFGFSTVMDFAWEDMFDAMAGQNRKSRRVMEDENQKIRRRAKREYNDTVRRLAEFAKKRDKRVIEMQKKKNEEMEKKRQMALEKKKEMEREKAERLKAFKEQEWAKVEEEEDVEEELEEEDERNNELYCVACGKKFKSDKQWKNHEKSKKHKEKVAQLREAFGDEDGEIGESVGLNGNESVSVDGEVDDLADKFEDSVEIQEPEIDSYDHGSQSEEEEEEEGVVNIDKGGDRKGDNDDEETNVLEKMVSGRKNRRKPKTSSKKIYVEVEDEEVDLMEYNNRKGSRRNRGGRKERNKRADEDEQEEVAAETISKEEESNGHDEEPCMNEPLPSQSPSECMRDDEADNEQPGKTNASKQDAEYDSDGRGDGERPGKTKASKQAADKKVTTRKDPNAKSKNVPKGRKQKASSRTSGHECETCGQDFESRNRLHKHLSDSGHATLKTR